MKEQGSFLKALKTAAIIAGVLALSGTGLRRIPVAWSFTTDNHVVEPHAISSGGEGGVGFTSHDLNSTVGEVSGSSVTFTNHVLYPGMMHLMSVPGAVSTLAFAARSSATITLSWTAPGMDDTRGALQSGSGYRVQFSTDAAHAWAYSDAQLILSTGNVTPGELQSATATGLVSNTTYYFRIWTRDPQGNISGISNAAEDMTLARKVNPLSESFLDVFLSSVTAAWSALPAAPSSATSNGYVLEASINSDFSGLVLSSATNVVAESTLTVAGLNSDTLYYFRVGTINNAGQINYAAIGSTQTDASDDSIPPEAVNDLTASTRTATSMFLRWTAPFDPTDDPFSGNYAIQHATWSGVAWSTANAQIVFSTSGVQAGTAQGATVEGLDPNTTHYFRIWASDLKPNWSLESNLANEGTLAVPPSDAQSITVGTGSVSFAWEAYPTSPPSESANGYRLEASTAVNFSGTILFSSTTNLAQSTLTVNNLDSNTTYYFRAGSLNFKNRLNFADTVPLSSLAIAPTRLSTDFLEVHPASVTVRWANLPASPPPQTSEGYRLEASTTAFDGSGDVYFSSTTNVLESTLTIHGLSPNTTYQFRVGSLNWNEAPSFTPLGSTSTLANTPVALSLVEVAASSVAVQWNVNGNPSGTNFIIHFATSSNFSGDVDATPAVASPIWVLDLAPNTTYYARIKAVNRNGVSTEYADLGSTVTLANVPGVALPAYSPLHASSVTVNFTAGSPANAAGTMFAVELSSSSDFSAALTSVTVNTNAVFENLFINTTYYARVRARNHAGLYSPYYLPDSTVTLTVPPANPFYSDVTHNRLTVNWSSGTLTAGFNPNDTLYQVQLSLVSNFFTTEEDVTTTAIANTFNGLLPNTPYYARVRALNRVGNSSAYAALGSTTTLASAIPAFIGGSFEVANAAGSYQSPSFYTNTTTPSVRVQIHSSAAPGLATSNIPAMKTIWNLDETSGTSAYDASRHNFTMTLAGVSLPTRVSGVIGNGLKFVGSSGYTVSPAVTAFRSSAANNVFTIEFWFKAGSTEDQGMVFSNSSVNTGGTNTGTADNQFGWTGGNFVWRLETTGAVGSNLAASQAYDDNQWHYAAGVLDAAGRYLYIDGVQVSSDALRTSANAMTYATLYSYLGTGTRLDGFSVTNWTAAAVDEVRISTVAYDADQISANYQLGKTYGHRFGANVVDISTQTGANFTWVRASTNAVSVSGSVGSTSVQTFTSSLSLSGFALRETVSPGADTNRITIFTSAVDASWDSNAYTILVDTTPPTIPPIASLTGVSTHTVTAAWSAASDILSGLAAAPYAVEASTNNSTFVPNTDSGYIALSSHNFTALMPNTTYYFRARAKDAAGNISSYSSNGSTMTLAMPVDNISIQAVYFTSATLNWNALPVIPSSSSAFGYRLEASSTNFTSGVVRSSESAGVALAQLTVSDLLPNTTYAFRVASLNALRVANFANASSTSTLANPPGTPAIQAIHVTSATVVWSLPAGGSVGFRLEAATAANFTGDVKSSVTANAAALALTIINLDPNSTHYFRVGSLNWNHASEYAAAGSTSTLALPVTRIDPDALAVFTSSITIRWAALPAAPPSASAEGYRLEASSTGFNGAGDVYFSSTTDIAESTLTVTGLSPNIIYSLRAGSLNWNEAPHYVSISPTSSLANKPLSPQFESVFISSVVVSWTLPPQGAEGYRLEASTTENFSGEIFFADTDDDEAITLTVESLLSNTTYYVRVGAANWDAAYNYESLGSTQTQASIDLVPPEAVEDLAASTNSDTGVVLTWLAPADPTDIPLSGNYRIQHATWSGVAWSDVNSQINIATSNVSADAAQSYLAGGLFPNTTYYFRLWTQDVKPNLSPISNGATAATLARVPDGLQFDGIWESSTSIEWTAFPPSPSSASSFGYAVQVATAPNFTGSLGTHLINDVNQSTLTVTGLDRNTSYYYRVGSRNTVDARNYSAAIGTATLAALPTRLASDFAAIFITSATVGWNALPVSPQAARSEGYLLEGSSTNFSGGLVLSSQTSSVIASTLTVSGLAINTTYYFRVGSLNVLGVVNRTPLSSTSTLAATPAAGNPSYSDVSTASLTAAWSANGNGSGTLYETHIATAANFTGNISTLTTTSLFGIFTGLTPNATYYGRVRTINHNTIPTAFFSLGSTVTRANPPGVATPGFDPVQISSLTVRFTAGSPANPDGTLYEVALSSHADYSMAVTSATTSFSAEFIGLLVNTTYYGQARSRNHLGIYSDYAQFGSTSTLAVTPSPDATPFTNVTYNSIDFQWLNGTESTGFNPDDTRYHAQISLASNFASILDEAFVDSMQAGFTGLVSNTEYHLRVRAVNRQGIPTEFLGVGSTITSISATPSFLGSTFEVANATGGYQSSTFYTNTTTPSVRVQVHSNASPGLAITDIPAMMTIWHLDEPSGTAFDVSRHNFNLTLGGASPPTRVAGIMGSALQHSGAAGYAVSPALTGFRSSAANNIFTVEFWFKAGSAEDQGMVFSNSSINNGGTNTGTADNQFGWVGGNFVWRLETTGAVGSNLSAGQAYDDNQWHYAAGVLNSAGRFLYIDGDLVNSDALRTSNNSMTYATLYSYLGTGTRLDGFAVTNYYAGAVDEVRISTVAYDADQISANYELGKTLGHGFGANVVDISTQTGTNFTWVRSSTNAISVSGPAGSTSVQTFTSSLSLSGFSLRETVSPGANTNRITIFASAIDASWASNVYTILVDTTPPTIPSIASLTDVSTHTVTAVWSAASDPLSGLAAAPYAIEASTNDPTFLPNIDSGYLSSLSYPFSGLMPNTTYYFRTRAKDAGGNISLPSANASTMTLTLPVENISIQAVYFTSATLNWSALTVLPSSSSAFGYRLEASSTNFTSGVVRSSESVGVAQSALTVSDLLPNTTYAFRVASLNALRATNFAPAPSTSTLANPPGTPAIPAVHVTSATISWSVPSGGSVGFRLEAATAANFTGDVKSSVTANAAALALTVINLDPNSTHYFRVGSLNWNNIPAYAAAGSTITRTNIPSDISLEGVFISSISITWSSTAGGSSGYRVEAATTANFTGDIAFSSTTDSGALSLTVVALDPNTTYYVRAGSLNQDEIPAYGTTLSAITRANQPSDTALTGVFLSSITVAWSGTVGGSAGYRLEASTTANFSGTIALSSTSDSGVLSLTVNDLDANTTHYLRASALNGSGDATYAPAFSTSTLAIPITRIFPDILNVHSASVTVRWAALPAAPPDASAEGYRLEASSTNFDGSGVVRLSSTTDIVQSTLTVPGLNANTTYYFRVGALNWNEVPNFVSLSATSTLANVPDSAQFDAVYVSSLTVIWSVPAFGSRGYRLEASLADDFAVVEQSAETTNGGATTLTLQSLSAVTTYYVRVGAMNWNGALNYTPVGSTQTASSDDPSGPEAVDDLAAQTLSTSALRLTWQAPFDPTNNPLDGKFIIQIATWTDVEWSTTNAQIQISTLNVTADTLQTYDATNLMPNTTYYARLWTQDVRPNTSPISNGTTSATLAMAPEGIALDAIFETSATVTWSAFPAGPSSASVQGLRLDAAVAGDFSGLVLSSTTRDATSSSLIVSNLDRNTTYHFRVVSLNWADTPNPSIQISTSTLTSAPAAIAPPFLSAGADSLTVRWANLPNAPPAETSEGYRLELSSTNFNGSGATLSSATTSAAVSTLTVGGLSANVTYYAHVSALNWNGVPNTTVLGATSTLANTPLSAGATFTTVTESAITTAWLDAGNTADTQYELNISSHSNFSANVLSSATRSLSASIGSLLVGTTYYARVRAVNHSGVPTAYLALGSTVTRTAPPGAADPVFSPVYISSLTVNITSGTPANPAGTRYEIDRSTDPAFTVFTTSDTLALSATFTGLSPNTTTYARARSVNAFGDRSSYTALGSTVTLAIPPGPATSTFTAIGNRYFTLNWSSGVGPNGFNPTGTLYGAEISLAPTFTSPIEIQTDQLSATFSGLEFGTTYYARVRARNHQGLFTAYVDYGDVATTPSSQPEFLAGTFEVTNAAGAWIDGDLFTDTTTVNVRAQAESRFAPGLAVTETASDLAIWRFDEGSGSSVADAGARNNTLTLKGSPLPTWTSGHLEEGVDFDGSQNHATSGTLYPWRSTSDKNAWTIQLWFKSASNVGYLFQAANKNTGVPSAFDLDIGWHNTSGHLAFALRTSGGVQKIAESAQSYADGEWHFVTAVLDSSAMRLYVDGTQAAANTEITAATARTFATEVYAWIGGAALLDSNIGNGSKFTTAIVDEVRLSTVPFDADRVLAEYNLTAAGTSAGGPAVHLSTQSGAAFTWTRLSTNTATMSGSNGTTSAQTFTATNLSVIEGAAVSQLKMVVTSQDGNQAVGSYNIRVDTTPPVSPSVSYLTEVGSTSLTVNITGGSDGVSGLAAVPFRIDVSTDPAFSVSANSGFIALSSHNFTGLMPNSTYYARAVARDAVGNLSGPSANVSSVTWSKTVSNLAVTGVYFTSATISWVPLNLTPSSGTAKSYTIQVSSQSDFGFVLESSSTENIATNEWTANNLRGGTTYYFRVGSLNNADATNYTMGVSTLLPTQLGISLSTDTLTLSGLINLNTTFVISTGIVVTNAGNTDATFEFMATTATLGSPWKIAASTTTDRFVLSAIIHATEPVAADFGAEDTLSDTYTRCTGSALTSAGATCVSVPVGESRTIWFKLAMPDLTTTGAAQDIRITGKATVPD